MSEVKIKVKCIACGFTKDVGSEEGRKLTKEKSMPTCDKCFSPMIAQSAKVKK